MDTRHKYLPLVNEDRRWKEECLSCFQKLNTVLSGEKKSGGESKAGKRKILLHVDEQLGIWKDEGKI